MAPLHPANPEVQSSDTPSPLKVTSMPASTRSRRLTSTIQAQAGSASAGECVAGGSSGRRRQRVRWTDHPEMDQKIVQALKFAKSHNRRFTYQEIVKFDADFWASRSVDSEKIGIHLRDIRLSRKKNNVFDAMDPFEREDLFECLRGRPMATSERDYLVASGKKRLASSPHASAPNVVATAAETKRLGRARSSWLHGEFGNQEGEDEVKSDSVGEQYYTAEPSANKRSKHGGNHEKSYRSSDADGSSSSNYASPQQARREKEAPPLGTPRFLYQPTVSIPPLRGPLEPLRVVSRDHDDPLSAPWLSTAAYSSHSGFQVGRGHAAFYLSPEQQQQRRAFDHVQEEGHRCGQSNRPPAACRNTAGLNYFYPTSPRFWTNGSSTRRRGYDADAEFHHHHRYHHLNQHHGQSAPTQWWPYQPLLPPLPSPPPFHSSWA